MILVFIGVTIILFAIIYRLTKEEESVRGVVIWVALTAITGFITMVFDNHLNKPDTAIYFTKTGSYDMRFTDYEISDANVTILKAPVFRHSSLTTFGWERCDKDVYILNATITKLPTESKILSEWCK